MNTPRADRDPDESIEAATESEPILVVDDEAPLRQFIEVALSELGRPVYGAATSREALDVFDRVRPALVVLDYMMPGPNGLDTLAELKKRDSTVAVIMATGQGNEAVAVAALKAGASDYLTKPFRVDDLLERARQALDERRRRLEGGDPYEGVVRGPSEAMAHVYRLVERAAPHDLNVLLEGETGTGKEVIARLIHRLSSRADRPFYAINCAAIPTTLLESELFGHKRGAFTGADTNRPGLFRDADGGTLFLDEVGEIDLAMQPKLLRVIQFGEVKPVGSMSARKVDVRIIAATNRSLEEAIASGTFREDLFYRLDVIRIHLPPLRERTEDISVLAASFVAKYAAQTGKDIQGLSPQALRWLEEYSWPGNVRELENVIERAVVLARTPLLTLEDVRPESYGGTYATEGLAARLARQGFYGVKRAYVEEIERRMLEEALRLERGNVYAAAAFAQIPPSYFYRKLRKYDIDHRRFVKE